MFYHVELGHESIDWDMTLECSFKVIMAQENTNRWARKILSFPVFSDDFAQALMASPFANLALIASMEVGSPAAFVAKVADWSTTMDPAVAAVLLGAPLQLEQFWSLASSVERSFFESTANQLGFGLCEPVRALASSPETARLKRAAAIQDMFSKQLKAPRRAAGAPEPPSSSSPLLDQENAERHKWAARLEEIGRRAGSHAKLWDDPSTGEGLSPAESEKLRHLVLTAGAPRTMAAYVRTFERLETWFAARGLEVFPLTTSKIMKYMLHLNDQECRPTVIPTLRAAVRWVCARLVIECPSLDEPAILALQQEVITQRAEALKEAVPIPIKVIGCVEEFVVDEAAPDASRIFMWWWLCLVFASLRFDDGKHVRPTDLRMQNAGLFGMAWQTKVDRKKRGTRFAIPHVGFRNSQWLQVGWVLFGRDGRERDFWIPELNTRSEFMVTPPTHQRAVQWLKVLAREALEQFGGDRHADEWRVCARTLNTLTAHSARVTLLDAAVHAGRSTEEIGLQANWKDPGPMVLKYTRNRSSVPARMIHQLVRDLVADEHPVHETPDVELEDAGVIAEAEAQFFIKTSSAASSYEYKFHSSALEDPSAIACGKLAMAECSAVGSELPDLSVLCKACAKARPDLVLALQKPDQP